MSDVGTYVVGHMLDDGSVVPFGQRLQELLDARGPEASQAWLAKRSGVDRSLISRVVKGKREATIETLECLAPALDLKLPDLVCGTDAEPRLREGDGLVRRADYDEAVSRFIEYERKNRDLDARVRAMSETLDREQAARRAAEQGKRDAMERVDRANERLADIQSRYTTQTKELLRYQEALGRAVSQFSLLKKRIEDLQKELGDAKQSSRMASVLAGVAAVTGVATIAHFLGEDDNKKKGKRR
jgi:transcriptional regulator with XRE-family HTH domain